MGMAGQNLSSEQLDFGSFWKPDPDPAVRRIQHLRTWYALGSLDIPWYFWSSWFVEVYDVGPGLVFAVPGLVVKRAEMDPSRSQAAKAIELKAPSSLPAVPEGTIGERSCGSELVVSCCIHIVHIFWAMVSQGVPRLQKLHDRFERADNSLFYWSNGWCLFLTCGSRMAPLPCTWSSVTKHQPKFGTERDRKGPFLLSTMCWLTTVIYYIIYWLCHHFSLVERYNFILFKTRRSQSPTFGLDFGSYDLDFLGVFPTIWMEKPWNPRCQAPSRRCSVWPRPRRNPVSRRNGVAAPEGAKGKLSSWILTNLDIYIYYIINIEYRIYIYTYWWDYRNLALTGFNHWNWDLSLQWISGFKWLKH